MPYYHPTAIISDTTINSAAITLTPTIYVDQTLGNDSNLGTLAAPYKTLAKVNGLSLIPGDVVGFKRGEVWREQLTIPSSGVPGNPVTFCTYGSGALPVINGANLVTSWSDNGGSVANTWSASVTTEPKIVIFDSTRGTNVASVAACNGAGKWFWSSNVLYTYGTVNPASTYSMIEAGARNTGTTISGKNYITLDGLDLRNTNQFAVYIAPGTNITIQNSTISQVYFEGININGGAGTSTSITYTGNTVSQCGSTGLGAAGDADSIGSITISYNTVSDCGWNTVTDGYSTYNAGIKVWGGANILTAGQSDNVLIENNTVTGQLDTHSDYSGTGIWVDQWGNNAVVRYNTVYGNAAYGILVENPLAGASPTQQVYYNLVYSNNKGISVNRDASNVEVYNNVIYANTLGGLICEGVGVQTAMVANLFKNNIATGNTPNLQAILGGENAGGGSGNVYLNNSFGPEAASFIEWGAGVFKSTYAAFDTAYGGVTNSVTTDPLLVSPPSDFHLQAGSPCINAGLAVGIALDFDDAGVGNPPEVGAYEK